MNMRAVILQPGYLPWLGFFDQFHRSDVFVFYDDVQFDRRGWRHRNRIKAPVGAQWLTVPVLKKGRYTQSIRETQIDPTCAWQRQHLGRMRASYAHTPYFDQYYPGLERVLQGNRDFLIDLDLALIEQLLEWLELQRPIRLASEIGGDGRSTQRLLEICRLIGATEYLSGDAASAYLDTALFAAHGIRVEFQHYAHPVYRQQFEPFVSHLSVIDLLFNHGPESLPILTGQVTVPAVAEIAPSVPGEMAA
jgi:WbqC-like protein